jgi:TatD DNase family protein
VRTHQNKPLCDAHFHTGGPQVCAAHAVCNGTSPEDWTEVLKTAADYPTIIPAIGLHPWKIRDAPHDWRDRFLQALDDGARAVGEIGLDRHFQEETFEAQSEAFIWQLAQAAERDLPVSIHCLKATDPLLRLLREQKTPDRGIHLHAFSGSAEEVSQFVEVGAYFSLHANQLESPARKAPEAIQRIPLHRLLLETDAPETLPESVDQLTYLETTYERAAALRGVSVSMLTTELLSNFERYFLSGVSDKIES